MHICAHVYKQTAEVPLLPGPGYLLAQSEGLLVDGRSHCLAPRASEHPEISAGLGPHVPFPTFLTSH